MNLTRMIAPLLIRRAKAALANAADCEASQRQQLAQLIRAAARTAVGRRYGFGDRPDYAGFASRVPAVTYPDIRDEVMRMVAGERDVLWPGVTRRFAQSSGTSDGRSKFIPVTDESLRRNHYRGSADAVGHYLRNNPDSRIFNGPNLILGGSFATDIHAAPRVRIGDLSANLIDAMNPLANLVRIPSKRIALMEDWNAKLPALVAASLRRDIRSIAGVPSWFLTLLRRVMEAAGAPTIRDVWPNLEVFFHGGISFAPYRDQYRDIIGPGPMHYVETYNASEGFFAVQDRPEPGAMLLLTDAGVFYEFLAPGSDVPLPAWEVSAGSIYELIITACNGLWRYRIGDTVRIVTTDPLRISIAGRTKLFINAFGEELMIHNAEAAMARTCAELGCAVANYTAAPVYAGDRTRGRHEWLIEFDRQPDSTDEFARRLDLNLQSENSDYAAKRTGSLFLDRLTVVTARRGLFDAWLASTGKLGGQRKVPRLANDRRIIDPLLALNRAC